MDRVFKELLETRGYKGNPDIMNGLAVPVIERSVDYLRTAFETASKMFPEGLVYHGIEHVTIDEEFAEETKVRQRKSAYDLAVSDLYMIKVLMTFNGEPLQDKYLYIPFLRRFGLMKLGGSMYSMSPVLMDKIISADASSVFVRLQKHKMRFSRIPHTITVDGTRRPVQVLYTDMYKVRTSDKLPKTTKAMTTAIHYLLAKYGLTETFKRVGVDILVGDHLEMTEDKYPKDQYTIITSTGIKPRGFKERVYTHLELAVVIPNDQFSANTESMVGALFYIWDHFPVNMNKQLKEIKDIDSPNLYKLLMGYIVFSAHNSPQMLLSNICDHFESIDDYIDAMVKQQLQEQFSDDPIGFNEMDNFFDMLYLLIANANNMVAVAKNNTNSLKDRNYDVLYNVYYILTTAINTFNFRLRTRAAKGQLTRNNIEYALRDCLSTRRMHGIRKVAVFIDHLNYAGDNAFIGITSKMAMQPNVVGSNRKSRTKSNPNASMRAHSSMIQLGSPLSITKSNLNPAVSVNPTLKINLANGNVISDPEFDEVLDNLQHELNKVGKPLDLPEEDDIVLADDVEDLKNL